MRKANVGEFPYTSPVICYIFVENNGDVKQIGADITKEDAFFRAENEEGKIIAVWPGRYRSDAFNVDILDFGKIFGFL